MQFSTGAPPFGGAPGAVPGFGPLLPADDAQRLIADMVGDNALPSASPGGDTEPLEKPSLRASREEPSGSAVKAESRITDVAEREVADQRDDAATQQEATDDRLRQRARRHGGALPVIYDEET